MPEITQGREALFGLSISEGHTGHHSGKTAMRQQKHVTASPGDRQDTEMLSMYDQPLPHPHTHMQWSSSGYTSHRFCDLPNSATGRKNNPLGDVSDLNHRTAGCFLHKVVTIEYILKCWPMYLFKVRLLSERHWFVVFVLPALHILLTPSPMSSVLYKYTEASLCASLPLEPAASRDLVSVVSAVKARAPPRRLQGSPLQPLQEHGPETKHTSENA